MHHFKSSLKVGQAGETMLQKMFPTWRRMDGRRADFETPGGKKVELKYESRTTVQTPNVALEVYSGHGIGAIARAVEHGMDYIIYLFSDGKYFVYDPVKLFQFMTNPKKEYRIVNIPNPKYETIVMLVPRDDLKGCEIGLDGV